MCIKLKLEGLWGHNVEPVTRHKIDILLLSISLVQIDFSTIDGNVKFVHFQYTVFWRHTCQQIYVTDKVNNNSDDFRIKFLSYSKIRPIVLDNLFAFSVSTYVYCT